ncbi:hypothetical protein F5148DRAFT_1148816 [Russula earlei]|uniref:Uncharacterized protein n=1 Tax=Russula earlei TaxID=71964 RepID=A0ACC0UD19_9AGAM|nr:hypothetical protein F5148DRAFT_1148816 [Russula earlei]
MPVIFGGFGSRENGPLWACKWLRTCAPRELNLQDIVSTVQSREEGREKRKKGEERKRTQRCCPGRCCEEMGYKHEHANGRAKNRPRLSRTPFVGWRAVKKLFSSVQIGVARQRQRSVSKLLPPLPPPNVLYPTPALLSLPRPDRAVRMCEAAVALSLSSAALSLPSHPAPLLTFTTGQRRACTRPFARQKGAILAAFEKSLKKNFVAALSSSLLSSALSSALPLLHPTLSGRSRREAGFRFSLPHSQSQHDGHDLHRDDGTPVEGFFVLDERASSFKHEPATAPFFTTMYNSHSGNHNEMAMTTTVRLF